jgi:hypothetical protein
MQRVIILTKYFEIFDKKLRLTSKQLKDAKTKYNNVCKTLHKYYYGSKYDGKTKLLFGSYKKNTNIRPLVENQDVDVLFKIPKETFDKFNTYDTNGQSALLQEIRNILKDTYTTTEKISGWGKVVLIKTANGTHNIELLPAYELENGTFKIPNSENGGSWEIFNPKKDIDQINKSNNKTNGLTKKIIRMLKSWKRQNKTLNLKSFEIEQLVIRYFNIHIQEDLSIDLFLKILNFIEKKVSNEHKSFIKSAIHKLQKAKEYYQNNEFKNACHKLKEIFGDIFPSYKKHIKAIYEGNNYEVAPNEQFIEDMFEIDVDNIYYLKIDCNIEADGFRKYNFYNFLQKYRFFYKNFHLEFFIKEINIDKPYDIYWKVRNFGREAEKYNDLRGSIIKGYSTKREHTKYRATHYIECYIIKDNKCVAIDKLDVPIGDK